jgi:hypothetical protein
MDECILQQAEHYLDVTKNIFQNKGFLFSTAFIVGDITEVVKLDLSSEEKKNQYSHFIKQRFIETNATHLIVIQNACVYLYSPEQMEGMDPGADPEMEDDQNSYEALVVFISSKNGSEVWQIPYMRTHNGVAFAEKEIMRTIVSENWMINCNKQMSTQLN